MFEELTKKLPFIVKFALKLLLRWLLKEVMEELKEGIAFRVKINGEQHVIVIKLATPENPSRARYIYFVDKD